MILAKFRKLRKLHKVITMVLTTAVFCGIIGGGMVTTVGALDGVNAVYRINGSAFWIPEQNIVGTPLSGAAPVTSIAFNFGSGAPTGAVIRYRTHSTGNANWGAEAPNVFDIAQSAPANA